jgi:hypothetical protein
METLTHKEELKQLFTQLPSARLTGDTGDEVKLINYSILETIVSKMMNKAYYTGKAEGLDSLQSLMDEVFSK